MDLMAATFTGAMFAMEALAAEAIVEMMKHGAKHISVWMQIRAQVVTVTDDCIELTEEEIELVAGEMPELPCDI